MDWLSQKNISHFGLLYETAPSPDHKNGLFDVLRPEISEIYRSKVPLMSRGPKTGESPCDVIKSRCDVTGPLCIFRPESGHACSQQIQLILPGGSKRNGARER